MEYPHAPSAEVDAMVAFVDSMKAFEMAAIEQAEEKRREVEALFTAIDTDGGGSIELDEFLQLRQSTTHSEAFLTALFHAKDADGSGSIDMHEFVQLVEEGDLLDHAAAIMQHGNDVKKQAKAEQGAAKAAAMWSSSLTRSKSLPAVPGGACDGLSLSTRPTLFQVTNDALDKSRRPGGLAK